MRSLIVGTLGFTIGVPVGYGARALIAMLESGGSLLSIEEGLALLQPIWDEMDGIA